MTSDKLPQMCGIAVCAIVVLGIDAHPMLATALGVFAGALATFSCALAMRPKVGQDKRR